METQAQKGQSSDPLPKYTNTQPATPAISSNMNWGSMTSVPQPFDMRGVDRITPIDISRNTSLSDGLSREGSMTSASIHPLSSDSSPNNITTPESIRHFDPDKFFGDMNLSASGIDVVMNMGQDDPSVEFFTEMLAGNLNGN